jgi:hypothetical protein
MNVTAAVKLPPAVIRSMRKTQPTTAEISLMNGKRNLRRASTAARTMSSSSASRAHDQCRNDWFGPSQPHQTQRNASKTLHAMTETNAKMPAAIVRSRRRHTYASA